MMYSLGTAVKLLIYLSEMHMALQVEILMFWTCSVAVQKCMFFNCSLQDHRNRNVISSVCTQGLRAPRCYICVI